MGLLQFDGYYPADIAAYETQFGLPNVPLVNVPIDGGVSYAGQRQFRSLPGYRNGHVHGAGRFHDLRLRSAESKPLVDILSRMANDNFPAIELLVGRRRP